MRTKALTLGALAAAALLLAAPGAALTKTGPFDDNPWLHRTDLVIAHQGGNLEAPGNTLFALKEAMAKGADGFEIDLHVTKDGHVVLMHDSEVERTTNGHGAIQQLTLSEVKALDAAYWWVPDAGATRAADPGDYVYRGVATGHKAPPPGYTADDFKVPTLREVLEALPDALMVLELKVIELERVPPNYRPLEHRVAGLVTEYGRGDDTLIASFADSAVLATKALAPQVSTTYGLGEAGHFWATSQGPAPGAPHPVHHALQVPPEYQGVPVISEDMVRDAHANGLAVHVWTINDADAMRMYLDWGVDGILTDRPSVLLEVLGGS